MQLTLHKQKGRVVSVDAEDAPSGDQKQLYQLILDAIENQDSLTLTIEKHDGKIVEVKRKTPKKIRLATEQSSEAM